MALVGRLGQFQEIARLEINSLSSHGDTLRRLRSAGDEYFDLKCLIVHKIDFPLEHFAESCDLLIGPEGIAPVKGSQDWFEFCYYIEKLPKPLNLAGTLEKKDIHRSEKRQFQADSLMYKLEHLCNQAYGLAAHIGLSSIPGTKDIKICELYPSHTTWLWLLFQAAWSCPAGSALRAHRYYPTKLMTKAKLTEKKLQSLGYCEWPIKSIDRRKAKDRIDHLDRAMSQGERSAEELKAYSEVCLEARGRLEEGEYVSALSMDPFTASAALLELIAPANLVLGDGEKKKIKPKGKTVEIIRSIQAGSTNDQVADTTGASIANIRTIRHRLNCNIYEI